MTSADQRPFRQAVILAGGQATRLRPHTDDRPKPLVPLAGATIFEHQVRWLAAGGVEHVVVSCGYRSDVFTHFVETTELPVAVSILTEDEPLGRGGGLKYGARNLPFAGERWLGLNGDVLTDSPLRELCEHHDASGAMATIAVARLKCQYGVLELDDADDRVQRFVESPLLPHWVNGGMYAFEPEVIDLLPDKGDHEDTTFPELSAAGKLFAYRIQGRWRGIDTGKDLVEAARELSDLLVVPAPR